MMIILLKLREEESKGIVHVLSRVKGCEFEFRSPHRKLDNTIPVLAKKKDPVKPRQLINIREARTKRNTFKV